MRTLANDMKQQRTQSFPKVSVRGLPFCLHSDLEQTNSCQRRCLQEVWRGLKMGESKTFNYRIYLRLTKKQILTTDGSHLHLVGGRFLASVSGG